MKNKKVLYFIGQALAVDRGEGRRDELIRQIESGAIDWERFVFLASNHRVLQVLYQKFQQNDLLRYLPEELAEHLAMIYQLSEQRNSAILNQIETICYTLQSIGVEPIFLKGSANLLDGLYAEIGARIMVDIDFLVEPERVNEAAGLLMANGYATYENKYEKSTKHYPRLTKADEVADIEVHFSPVSAPYSRDFSYQTIQKNKKRIKQFPNCFVLADEDKLMLNFIHAQLNNNGYRYKSLSLRNLYDVLLLSQRVDLCAFVAKCSYTKEVDAYFSLARELFGLNDTFYRTMHPFSTHLFILWHNFFLNHPLLFKINRRVRFYFRYLIKLNCILK